MGYTIFLSLNVGLRPEPDDQTLRYLAWLTGEIDASIEDFSTLQSRFDDYGQLPGPEWFDSPRAAIAVEESEPGHPTVRLNGSFHDDFVQHETCLIRLLASCAVDGPLGASWTDMSPTTATTYVAADGNLFGSQTGNRLLAMSASEPDRVPPVDPIISRRPAAYFTQHGLEPEAAETLAAAPPHDAAEARMLLARSIWRAVDDVLPNALPPESRHQAVARVLSAIDSGRDEIADPNSPGWAVVETHSPPSTFWKYTGRPIQDTASIIDIVAASDVRAGPRRLTVGTRISMIRPVNMQATKQSGPLLALGDGGQASHVLTVDVPAGTELVVSRCFDRGHAVCTATDWQGWGISTVPGRPASATYPAHPIGNVDDYELAFINPSEQDVLYRIVGE